MPDKRPTLSGVFRDLLKRLGFDGYDPARHYMRGPGPKSKALQRSEEQPGDGTPPTRSADGPGNRRR